MAKVAKAKTKIEENILKITRTKAQGAKESDQDYFERLAKSCQEITDAEWDKLSNDAQVWCNGAIEQIKAGDAIDPPSDEKADDDEGDGDETGEGADEGEGDEGEDGENDENEGDGDEAGDSEPEPEPTPRRRRSRDRDDKDEAKDEPKPTRRGGAADSKAGKGAPKAEPKKSNRGSNKAGKDESDEATKGKRGPRRTGGAQETIKKLIIEDPTMTTDQLIERLKERGLEMTKLAASTIRSGMLQSIRLLQDAGKIKGMPKIA